MTLPDWLVLLVKILYIGAAILLVLVVLLQAGRGGGLGTALAGGASQSVFGGGGGADFMAKVTQGLAAVFMVGAVILAYAGAHQSSERLQAASEELDDGVLAGADEEVDYERVGPNPLPLPLPGEAKAGSGDAAPEAVPQEEAPPVDAAPAEAPAEVPAG